ncbi:MAG: arginine--tRNA ligase, partial [Candidatus Omnitrophica bacterium]|nr:arginine--tRNA ligase [Candidatus Omnitrophota bacterium]
MMSNFNKKLSVIILESISSLSKEGIIQHTDISKESLVVDLEMPKDKSHGDISTNIALKISKAVNQDPMAYADKLAAKIGEGIMKSSISAEIDKVEAKKPGFINFWFSKKRVLESLHEIVRLGTRYGSLDAGIGEMVNIEFVSANPTGPLTIAHGRQAAFGDSLANILSFANAHVKKEYYINDEGNQMTILGKSIKARYFELCGQRAEMPEGGYKGSYIIEIASAVKSKHGEKYLKKESIDFFVDFGCQWILEEIRKDLKDFNVT